MTRGLLATGLAAGMLVGTGCGGPAKPLTRAQLLVKADAICKRVDKQLSGTTIKSEKQLIHYLPRVAGYEQQALVELSKLNPPNRMAEDWKKIVAGAQTIADSTAKLAEAARLKEIKTVHEVLSEIGKVQTATTNVAKRDGFKNCSQTP